MSMFDALIVGAGPAGSYLAYLLAKAGRAVAIIDRARFPRDKVCGGGLTRKARSLIDFDIAPVVQETVGGAFVTFRNRASVILDVDPPVGCTVLRSEFDHFLLRGAEANGAQFHAATRFVAVSEEADGVRVTTDRGEIRARFLVAADGVGSAVRNQVFGRNMVSYVPALEALIQVEAERIATLAGRAVFDLGGMRRGYGWIFPKRDHLNVGVYSPFGGTGLRAQLDQFLGAYPPLATARAIKHVGYAIPTRNPRKQFERGPVWLVGDAAGLAEATFGEGIYFALKSATLAARALLESEGRPGSYTSLLKREVLPELTAARHIGRTLFAFPEFAFHHLAAQPGINSNFSGIIGGDVSYRSCLARTIASLPRWLLSRGGVGPPLLQES
jgi:geranylgeranyl reductase family protein